MERQRPKNVRQIGNVSDNPKIYVEDYVDTFFIQLGEKCEKNPEEPLGAFLVGDIQKYGEEDCVYIYGAVQMHSLKLSGNEYIIDEDTWKKGKEECKKYFPDGAMVGWFVSHPGGRLDPSDMTVKTHKKAFPKKNTVFIISDPEEKEEIYFAHKLGDLLELGGHYTYYEKNPCMQDYMIAIRKKNGTSLSETVEDKAAKEFRNLVRERGKNQKRRKTKMFYQKSRIMYAMSTCLVLIMIVMGVSMVRNFDKMKSVQKKLDTITEEAKKADAQTAQETSGEVTSVNPDSESGENSDGNQEESEVASQQTQDLPTPENDGNAASVPENENQDTSSEIAEGDEENGSNGIYIVEKGDTLAIISKKMYGDLNHVDAICRMNGLGDGNLIYIGQKLILP